MNSLVLVGLRWLGGVAMVLAVLGYVYHMGASSARGECDAAAVRQELEIAKADLAEIEKKHVEADQRAQLMDGRAQTNERKADELARQLEEAGRRASAPPPAPIIVDGKCPAPAPAPYVERGMSDADASKLRAIRRR